MSIFKKYKSTKFSIIVLSVYLFFTFILYLIEKDADNSNIRSFSDSLWYSIITLTSVGYGDKVPISGLGKIVSLIFILGSLGMIGFIVGRLTNKISKMIEEKKLGFNGTHFENHIVIINYNQFAQQILKEVVNAEKKVVVVTSKKEDVDLIYRNFDKKFVFVLYHDYIDINAFEKTNINKSCSVLLNFDEDTENLVNMINLRETFHNLNFVISLNNPSLKDTFRALGVTFTLSKNEVASKLVASYVFEPEVAKLTEELMSSSISEDDLGFMQYKIVEGNYYLNMKFLDVFMEMKKELNVILVSVSKHLNGKYQLIKNPTPDMKIELNDYLVVIGSSETKKKMFEKFIVEEGI